MKPWQAEFVQSLEAASDVRRQRVAWVDRTGPFFPDPVELICQIFDDSAIEDLMAKGVVFSEATDAAIRRLHALVSELDLNQEPERLLSSEGWTAFAREAGRVRALVRGHLAD